MTITDRRYGPLASVAMKAPVRLATTANITLSGLQSIDGTTTADQDRVLVKDQTAAEDNGIYIASSDTWSRATDFDADDEIVDGTIVLVTGGSANLNAMYRLSVSGDITIGTTELAFELLATLASLSAGATVPDGSEGTPSINNTDDTNTGLFFPAADEVALSAGGTQRLTVSGANLLHGHTAAVASVSESGGALTPGFQRHALTEALAASGSYVWIASAVPARYVFNKSRGASAGTHTIVEDGDDLGAIVFAGSDGTDFEPAAAIRAEVDGSPGAGDMPGRLVFGTTSDAGETVTDRLILDRSGVLKPAANDGVALGTTALGFSDLHLATGGVINWANGEVTLTGGANTLTIAGGNLVTAAGTAAEPGLQLTSGTAMITPAAGAIEMDATNFYGTTDTGNRGYIPVRHFIRANAARTLPDDANLNAIFEDPAGGTLTLEVGTYLFEGLLYITNMDATSGNALINILGAGTATTTGWLWSVRGIDATDPTAAAAQTGSFAITSASVASAVTAGVGTAMAVAIKGTFEVTVAGTIIPSIDQVTANAASVNIGSYLAFERIGTTSVVSVGQWT